VIYFLKIIKAYRDQFKELVDLGFKAVLTCVDSKVLYESFAGKIIDHDFLASLPANVDPCGEKGEFHTFVFDGPNFKEPVRFFIGETVQRDSFWFCDLLPE